MALLLSFAMFWHGVHMSTATVDFQTAAKRLEIVITLSAQHLEEILSRKSGAAIELDRTKNAESLAKVYVLSNFEMKNQSGNPLPLKWIGWELKGGSVNCFVETAEFAEASVQLRNDLLLDWQRDQTNRVLPKKDGKGKPPQLLYWIGNSTQFQTILF